MFRLTQWSSSKETFDLELSNGFEGKLARRERFHKQVWTVLIYRPGAKEDETRLLVENFDKFEDAFYYAMNLTDKELNDAEAELVAEDLAEDLDEPEGEEP